MEEFNNLEEINSFIKSGEMRLLYLSTSVCGVCEVLKPKIATMIEKYPKIKMGYVDMEKIPESAGAFSIFTIPGVLLYVEGKETIREARHISLPDFESKVKRYYGMIFE